MLVGNFEKNPRSNQDPVLWLWLVSDLRGNNSKTTHHLLSYFFQLNNLNLKGTAKAPVVDFLRLNTLGDTKTAFFNSKTWRHHRHPFYMGVPPESPLPLTHVIIDFSAVPRFRHEWSLAIVSFNCLPLVRPWQWRHISDFYNVESSFCPLGIRGVPLYLTRFHILLLVLR